MSTIVAGKPGRKFPPLCWTRDEALVLIQAYRERWYALHRAFLKNPDWDAVAEKVTSSCPDVTPPKTSAQCRHKMEKLRQRHRAEKQRASSFPAGRFHSTWFYFEAMEAMEKGPDAEIGNNTLNNNSSEIGNGVVVSDHRSLNPGRGIRFKPSHVQNLVSLAATPVIQNPNFESRVSNPYVNNWGNQQDDNEEEEEEEEDGYLLDSYKNHKHRIKTPVSSHQERKFSKVVHNHNHNHEVDDNGEMWVKVPRGGSNQFHGNNMKQQGKKRSGINEVVSSIKVLGDGFMKMEKMKIDMVREIERMRMETEMKRNQLILESQKQIVDAFVKGVIETRKQGRTRTGSMAD